MRIDRSSPLPRSSCFSIAAEIHSATTSTRPAVSVPSTRLRSVSLVVPTFQLTSSIASSSSGSTPVIHSTTASQAIHDTVRSITRTQPAVGKVTCSTRTARRITSSDSRIGIASLNTAIFTVPASSSRAPKASASASTGNSTPSMMRSPNQIEPVAAALPRSSAHDHPGQAQAAGQHAELGQRGGLQQRVQQVVEFGGVQRSGHGRVASRGPHLTMASRYGW